MKNKIYFNINNKKTINNKKLNILIIEIIINLQGILIQKNN